jgi:hypothetical protein
MSKLSRKFRHCCMYPRFGLAIAFFLCAAAMAYGQQPAGAGTSGNKLPDSPQPKQPQAASSSQSGTASFIGYITNRSLIFPDIATRSEPLSPGEKFGLFVNQGISPAYILAAGVSGAVNQARDVPESTGQGWDAYGTRVGYTMARASSTAFFGTFLFASILRQDPRFFPEYRPSLGRAIKYSAQRLVVTRNDHGKDVFNASGLLGPLAAETLANVYLPQSEQTGAKTMERYGTDLAWRFAANMFKEYWPTVFHSLGLQRLKVVPGPGVANP